MSEIGSLCTILALLAVPTFEQDSQGSTLVSPCPNVFTYEPPVSEPDWWSGVVILSTDSLLHSLWLNIVLDSVAIKISNWVGEVTTKDSLDFRIENSSMQIQPGLAVSMRFAVQYDPRNEIPKLQAIRLNGRVICDASTIQPTVMNRYSNTKQHDSISSRRESIHPVYQRPINNPVAGIIDLPSRDLRRPTSGTLTTSTTDRRTTKRPNRQDDDNEDYESSNTDDYFSGKSSIVLNPENTTPKNTDSQMQCGMSTLESQWPWRIALYKTKDVNYEYICGGTLIGHRHVITGAQCVHTSPSSQILANENTLTVYLGKHNLRTSVRGVQIRFVEKVFVHPDYNMTFFTRDVAILELQEPVMYTDWVRPACLWPENEIDLNNVIGKKGWLVGWGFDDEKKVTEEPSQVEMPVVDQETCISSQPDFFGKVVSHTSNTYCAGNRDEVACKGASAGGGMVFRSGNTWYLRGAVSLSLVRHRMMESQCDPTHYLLFTDIAKYVPWIRQIVSDF